MNIQELYRVMIFEYVTYVLKKGSFSFILRSAFFSFQLQTVWQHE